MRENWIKKYLEKVAHYQKDSSWRILDECADIWEELTHEERAEVERRLKPSN
jgi:hypothetical protein